MCTCLDDHLGIFSVYGPDEDKDALEFGTLGLQKINLLHDIDFFGLMNVKWFKFITFSPRRRDCFSYCLRKVINEKKNHQSSSSIG